MKLYLGWVVSVGVFAGAATANAQVLVPYRIGAAPSVVVSDVDGPYAAIPPEMALPRYAPMLLPPREIYAILREAGFSPLGMPQQRGLVYTVSVIDRGGDDGRLVIDARNGRILRFMPAYRMSDRMSEEVVTSSGPAGAMPELPQYRRAPLPPAAGSRVASRTPTAVPLPKKSPARAVATPAKPVAPAVPVAVTPPVVAPAAPIEKQAVVEPKPDEVRVIPLTATPAAAPAAPTVAAPATEAKPTGTPASETAPATPAATPAQ